MTNILDEIVSHKRSEVKEKQAAIDMDTLINRLENIPSLPRNFYQAMQDKITAGNSAVIAEIKRASPSMGVLCEDFQPEAIAKAYEEGGAACLSVLTDKRFFQGNDAFIAAVHKVSSLPILRKDFIVSEYQVIESRVLLADCILLIAAVLDDNQLERFSRTAIDLGMEVIVEVSHRSDLERALTLPIKMIGINNRNLNDFSVSLDRSLELSALIPDDRLIIAESGIHGREDVAFLRNAGINAFLIGEALMRDHKRSAAIRHIFAKTTESY